MVHNYIIRQINKYDASMERWEEVESGILTLKEAKEIFKDYCESEPDEHFVLVRETIIEEN